MIDSEKGDLLGVGYVRYGANGMTEVAKSTIPVG